MVQRTASQRGYGIKGVSLPKPDILHIPADGGLREGSKRMQCVKSSL